MLVETEASLATLRVLVVDDHPMFRDAVGMAVRLAFPAASVTEAADVGQAVEALGSGGFDLALLDLGIPDVRGFEGLLRLRGLFPRLPVLVVSGHDDARIVRDALAFGAAGFVSKANGKTELARAMRQVLEGGTYFPPGLAVDASTAADARRQEMVARLATLTPQQARVLHMLKAGLLNKQIAHELGVGETTVKAHVSEILRKLDVFSRTQAVIEVSKLDSPESFSTGLPLAASR